MKCLPKTIALVVLLTAGLPGSAQSETYLLGPQDRLKVKVYDLRSASGEAHEWRALLGEFAVNAEGKVSFPIVGDIPAAGMDTGHLARELGMRLRDRVGLAKAPVASIEVSEYRPFYVMGAVDKPGEYKYRPGLTVLQAISVAGGLARFADLTAIGLQRDVVTTEGDLSAMRTEQVRLDVRIARLQAEIVDAVVFEYETGLPDAALSKSINDERLLFETFRGTKAAQSSGTKQSKTFLAKEIESLNQKDASLSRRLQAVQHELENVNALYQRGLTVNSRQTGLEETRAQLESSRLDVQLAIARARQDIIRADRDLSEITEKTRAQVLTEATEARMRLASLAEKIQTTHVLATQAKENLASSGNQSGSRPRYFLVRKDEADRIFSSSAEENENVRPGDTLKVERRPATDMRIGNFVNEEIAPQARRE